MCSVCGRGQAAGKPGAPLTEKAPSVCVAERVCAEHALTWEPWSAKSHRHGRAQGPSGNDMGERVSSPPVSPGHSVGSRCPRQGPGPGKVPPSS